MTKPIKVPQAHRGPVRLLAELDESTYEALDRALRSSGEIARSRFVAAVQSSAGVTEDDARGIVDAVIGAQAVLQRRSKPDTADVAVGVSLDPALELSDEQAETLARRLEQLLEIDDLLVLSRALQVLAEDEKTFCTVRTLSDMRPVFMPWTDPDIPGGVVIHHTLKIDYHVEQGTDSVYITVDDRALELLRAGIDRAQAKGRVMREVAKAAGLNVIDVGVAH